MARAQLCALITSTVHTHLKEAVFSPRCTPGVSNDPVLGAVASHNLIGDLAVSNQRNAVVHFSIEVRTLEEAFSDNTMGVAEEHASGNDSHSDGLLVQLLLQFFVRHVVTLHKARVLIVELTVSFCDTILFTSDIHVVVIFEHDTVLLDVGVRVEHPPARAPKVHIIAVHELLDRVLLKLAAWLGARDHGEGLQS